MPGMFVGSAIAAPFGAFVGKALTLKRARTHVQRCPRPLMERIVEGRNDPSSLTTHRTRLEGGQRPKRFRDKKDGCVKVVIRPNA